MNFKAVAVVILWAVYLYGLFLDIVRYRSARNPIPQNVADVYDRDTYLKWKAYHGEKVRFGIFSSAAGFVIDLVLILTDAYAAFARLFPDQVWWQLFAVMLLSALATLPLTTEEGATVSILAINSYYSNVDLRDATLLKEIADRAGVTIEWTLIDPSSYADSVSPMLASGKDLPDIIMMPDKDLNMDYLSSGLVEPLDEHFDLMPNYTAFLEKNPIIKGSLTAVDGHIYYVPQTVVTNNYQPVPVSGDAANAIMQRIDELSAPFGQSYSMYMVDGTLWTQDSGN